MKKSPVFLLPVSEAEQENITLNKKLKDLIALLQNGIYIPEGFIVLEEAYFCFLRENALEIKINDLLSTVHYERIDSLMQVSNHIKKLILSSKLSEVFVSEVSVEYKRLDGLLKDAEVLVGESEADTKNLDNLLRTIKEIWSAQFEAKLLLFNHRHHKSNFKHGIAIPVLKKVKSQKLGKSYTSDGSIKTNSELSQADIKKIKTTIEKIKKHFYLPQEMTWIFDKNKLYVVSLKPMTNAQKSYLVLVRHGESEWNAKGLWTGWSDPPLSELGRKQAKEAGLNLKDVHFDNAYTSALLRAIQTLDEIKKAKRQNKILTISNKALNERDYGALTGKNKWEVEKEFGEEQFLKWRRGWDDPIPQGESLKDVYKRVVPYYNEDILPKLKSGKNVIIAAHGNSLRALVKYLEDMSDSEVTKLEIPVGQILVYQIDEDGAVVGKEIRNQNENQV